MLLDRLVSDRTLHVGAFFTVLDINGRGFSWRAGRNLEFLLAAALESNTCRLGAGGIFTMRSAQGSQQALFVGI